MTRRDARRAELFRRLNASCEADFEEPPSPPHFPPSPPPVQAVVPEDDEPIWPPRSRYWNQYRSLKGAESNPENSLVSSIESSISPPQSSKRQKNLADTDGEQFDGDINSSECASQIDIHKDDKSDGMQDEQGEKIFSFVPYKLPKRESLNIGAYIAQCKTCSKWRLIPTKEMYEQLREHIGQNPFKCEKAREWKPDVTCDEPSDVSQDDIRLWAIDKPNIAQPPLGWERVIKIRSEGSTRFADVYYISPAGDSLRSKVQVEKYLADHPEYAEGAKLSKFSFAIPAPSRLDYVKKRTPTGRNDGAFIGLTGPVLEEVLPISWAPPPPPDVQGDIPLVLYNETHQSKLLQSEPQEAKPGSPLQPPAI